MKNLIQTLYIRFLIFITPMIKFVGKIYFKSSSKEHIFSRYYEIENALQPGDVILTKSDAHLSNLLNIGYWKHAVIYIGKENGIPMIIEAIGLGVVKRTLIEMLSSKDRILIIRPTEKLISNSKQMYKYISEVIALVGSPYDYNFDSFSSNAHSSFYCSELVFVGITKGNPDADFGLRSTFGIKTVSPMDLFNMIRKEKFKNILEIKR